MTKEIQRLRYVYVALVTSILTSAFYGLLAGEFYIPCYQVLFVWVMFWNDKIMNINRRQHKLIMELQSNYEKTYFELLEFNKDLKAVSKMARKANDKRKNDG